MPLVRLEIADGLATITLARAEAGNAMSVQLIEDFTSAVEALAADGSARAVLIEAEGRNFCVGGDLKAIDGDPESARMIGALARRLHEGVAILAALDAPVVVAVQGAAAGAGFSLAVGGDVVVAGESASFMLAYAAIGLVSDGGATWLLPRLVGLRRAQEMALLNRRLSAAEALDWGLVTKVVADDAIAGEARAIATRLAQGPTLAYGGIKRLLGQSFGNNLGQQLDLEAGAIADAMATEDAAGAVKAFIDRQTPTFHGR